MDCKNMLSWMTEHIQNFRLKWEVYSESYLGQALLKGLPCLDRQFSHQWKTTLKEHFFLTSRLVVLDRLQCTYMIVHFTWSHVDEIEFCTNSESDMISIGTSYIYIYIGPLKVSHLKGGVEQWKPIDSSQNDMSRPGVSGGGQRTNIKTSDVSRNGVNICCYYLHRNVTARRHAW